MKINLVLEKSLKKGFNFLYEPCMIKRLKHCKTLNVLNISDCIQFNAEHVTPLVELFQDLPCLDVFNAESTCQFSVANARVLLERNKLK